MLLQIIIISFNCKEYTLNCIESIYNTFSENASIIVVDNNSTDDIISTLNIKYPNVKIIKNPENYGYSKAVNIGVRAANSEYVLISNADVIYKKNTIQDMLDFIKANPKYALIGPRQTFPNGKKQFSGGPLPGIKLIIKNFLFLNFIFSRFHYGLVSNYDYIDGAVLLCSSQVFEEVNGFSEDFFFYSEDAEFSYKIKHAGYKIGTYNKANVIHFRGASTNIAGINEKALEMFVNAKIKLAELMLGKNYIKIYKLSEYTTTFYSKTVYVILSKILKKPTAIFKNNYYSSLVKIWKSKI